MPTNKKLPILKLLISPVIIGTAYGAYCYYRQQYYNKIHKEKAPIRYMQQLHKILIQSDNLAQVKRVYSLICKNMDKFVIDPSKKDEKILDTKIDRQVESRISLSSYFKVDRQYQTNLFNFRTQKKDGNFTLGLWSNLNEIHINYLKQADPIIKIAEKSLNYRQKKCREMAQRTSQNLDRGFLQEYFQCMGITEGYASLLKRQIDISKKIVKYQLVKQPL